MKHLNLFIIFTLFFLIIACDDSNKGTPEIDSSGQGPNSLNSDCFTEKLQGQAYDGFYPGNAFFLPKIDTAKPACKSAEWSLSKSPSSNKSKLIKGADGYTRFIPIVPGSYEFTINSLSAKQVLKVLKESQIPFENYNYYSVQSIAKVGEEIWLAEVYSPYISRMSLDGKTLTRHLTGSWPVALAYSEASRQVLVANKASDTISFHSSETGELIDALYVGDEPTNVVIDKKSEYAYVALSTESSVVKIDIKNRKLIKKSVTNFDPMAMSICGSKLFVASHRSSQSNRFPHTTDAKSDDEDIAVVNPETLKVEAYISKAGSTINHILCDDLKKRIYVAATWNKPSENLADLTAGSFQHRLTYYDAESFNKIQSADLSRQEGTLGYAVSLFASALSGDSIWVLAEGSNMIIQLDKESLKEKNRITVEGQARSAISAGEKVYIHGFQEYKVGILEPAKLKIDFVSFQGDPRSDELRIGQQYFVTAGEGYGLNHSCNNCHLDTLGDGNSWKAGPFDTWQISKPYFWLEGTVPMGWEGYNATATNFVISAGSTIGKNPTTKEAYATGKYMDSIVPPPAANGHTMRDGTMTAEAERGKLIYDGKGKCASCHDLPLGTGNFLFEESTDEGLTDTPSLISTYRFGYWLKTGKARTLEDAIKAMMEWRKNIELSDSEISDLTAYLKQLTAREFFLLSVRPLESSKVIAVHKPIELIFSHPLDRSTVRKSDFSLKDGGKEIDFKLKVEDRKVFLEPLGNFSFSSDIEIEVKKTLKSLQGKALVKERKVQFRTIDTPALVLEGDDYQWSVDYPAFDIPNNKLSDNTFDVNASAVFKKNPSGSTITIEGTDTLKYDFDVLISGDKIYIPAMVLPLGGIAFSGTWESEGTLKDEDGDGKADLVEAEFEVSGPGFRGENVKWKFGKKPKDVNSGGDYKIRVTKNSDGKAVFNWEGTKDAIGFYVIEPSAKEPVGPGNVTGGKSYWVLGTKKFPNGFKAPITYGVVPEMADDNSAKNGAKAGGEDIKVGTKVKIVIQFTDFKTSFLIMDWK